MECPEGCHGIILITPDPSGPRATFVAVEAELPVFLFRHLDPFGLSGQDAGPASP